MSAKSVRNAIIGLAILIGGLIVLSHISNYYISQIPNDLPVKLPALELIEKFIDAFIFGIGIIVIILIPVYFASKSAEKKREEKK